MSEGFTCSGCNSVWTGLNRCHCSKCHETFGGVSSFDKHLQPRRKKCIYPEKLGLTQNEQGVWVGVYGVD